MILSLDTINDIDATNPTAASIEVAARQLAKGKLLTIFTHFGLAAEAYDTIKDDRDDYSINP